MVSSYLCGQGIKAPAYHSDIEKDLKDALLEDLMNNRIDALVCTNAIGMGFDKPDLPFVIHYQSPKTLIEYYQQVGRAGRGLDFSMGVLFEGEEDREIQDFFITSAFPDPERVRFVLGLMSDFNWWTLNDLLSEININRNKW